MGVRAEKHMWIREREREREGGGQQNGVKRKIERYVICILLQL
jgi:hypothetical protein